MSCAEAAACAPSSCVCLIDFRVVRRKARCSRRCADSQILAAGYPMICEAPRGIASVAEGMCQSDGDGWSMGSIRRGGKPGMKVAGVDACCRVEQVDANALGE